MNKLNTLNYHLYVCVWCVLRLKLYYAMLVRRLGAMECVNLVDSTSQQSRSLRITSPLRELVAQKPRLASELQLHIRNDIAETALIFLEVSNHSKN